MSSNPVRIIANRYSADSKRLEGQQDALYISLKKLTPGKIRVALDSIALFFSRLLSYVPMCAGLSTKLIKPIGERQSRIEAKIAEIEETDVKIAKATKKLGLVIAVQKTNYSELKKAHNILTPEEEKELILAAVTKDFNAFLYARDELKNNRAFVLEAVKRNGLVLAFTKSSFQNDEEIVLAAVAQNGLALQDASDEMKKRKSVVKKAVAQNGLALKFADHTLQNNRGIARIAIMKNEEAIDYVLLDDAEFKEARAKYHDKVRPTLYYLGNAAMRLRAAPNVD